MAFSSEILKMDTIIKKFWLVGDRFLLQMHIRRSDLRMVVANHFIRKKTKSECKNSRERKTSDISIRKK